MSFWDYLESKAIILCAGGIGILFLLLVFWLCELPFSLLLICLFSGIFVFLFFLLFNWHRIDQRLRMLQNRLDTMEEKYLIGESLTRPRDAVELQYYLLMREISRSAIGAVEKARTEQQNYCEYVEQCQEGLFTRFVFQFPASTLQNC